MLKLRIKRQAVETARAVARLAIIETSIERLENEDLLDLADIFAGDAATPLSEIASAELRKRNLSL